MPDHGWARDGAALRREGPRFVIHATTGFIGYYAGPHVALIDCNALSDPLLARLPVDTAWRIGHFTRRLPAGYAETVRDGKNVLKDRELAEFHEELSRITTGPLWNRDRWSSIFRMNFGRLNHLLGAHTVEATVCDQANYLGKGQIGRVGRMRRVGRGGASEASGVSGASGAAWGE
jgi:arabinofuranosyltransferase